LQQKLDKQQQQINNNQQQQQLSQLQQEITNLRQENAKLHQKLQPQSQSPNYPEVPLESAVGYDYTQLRDLLAAGKWKEADEETEKAMLQVAGREEEGWLDVGNIDNFPCEDLRTIDRLWVESSNEKFGFSIQKEIYQNLGGTREFNGEIEIWRKFGDTVGWRKEGSWKNYSELNWGTPMTPNTPPGHLPVVVGGGVRWHGDVERSVLLFSRAEACQL
jgi:hypothetical protein